MKRGRKLPKKGTKMMSHAKSTTGTRYTATRDRARITSRAHLHKLTDAQLQCASLYRPPCVRAYVGVQVCSCRVFVHTCTHSRDSRRHSIFVSFSRLVLQVARTCIYIAPLHSCQRWSTSQRLLTPRIKRYPPTTNQKKSESTRKTIPQMIEPQEVPQEQVNEKINKRTRYPTSPPKNDQNKTIKEHTS